MCESECCASWFHESHSPLPPGLRRKRVTAMGLSLVPSSVVGLSGCTCLSRRHVIFYLYLLY